MQKTQIHPTAIVEKGAELGVGVQIGPYSIVNRFAQIHDGVKIHSHVVIDGRTCVGEQTEIWPFASIGSTPQDLKFRGEDTRLEIGKRNKIREYANLSVGTDHGGGITTVGDDNLLMVNTHIAHDC